MRSFVLGLVLLLAGAAAAHAEPVRLTLDQLTQRSLQGTRARMARADTAAARARVEEANAARLPTASATAFLAPSPELECADAACTATTNSEASPFRLSGAFGGVNLQLVQPLYTFGKIAAARGAAKDGLTAQRALEDATAGDLALEAARAYWGLKLARELVAMLEDGIAEIEGARVKLEERRKAGGGEVTIQDMKRLEVLLAEARAQLTEARAAEATALAGVRAIVATDATDTEVDIDDEPLEPVELDLSSPESYEQQAGDRRPEVRAAKAGARAATGLKDLESAKYWPDLAVVGSLGATHAQGVDDVPNGIYSEPYNNVGGGLALVLKWTIEPFNTHARVARARAAETRAHDLATLADTAATLEARQAYAEAAQAKARVTAADEGETAARGWLASVLQGDAIGIVEARDLADAYIAWFQVRARLATAIMQWNVATVRLARATGQYRAP